MYIKRPYLAHLNNENKETKSTTKIFGNLFYELNVNGVLIKFDSRSNLNEVLLTQYCVPYIPTSKTFKTLYSFRIFLKYAISLS